METHKKKNYIYINNVVYLVEKCIYFHAIMDINNIKE